MNGVSGSSISLSIVAFIAGLWMVFTKAGEDGWKSIIPIWNVLILLKIVGREWWWIILMLIPIVGSSSGSSSPSTWRRAMAAGQDSGSA